MQNEIRKYVMIVEGIKLTLSLNRLPYKKTDLDPVMSEATLDYHYGKLAKAYVDRYNSGEGDPKFNKNGADLHNIFFPQLQAPRSGNKPVGNAADFIERNFKTFDAFKDQITERAMGIQGSGWVFLDRSGNIQTIANHSITGNTDRIVLLIDWWEHAWALDYQSDKKKYLENFWRIVDWNVVNQRLI
jgi:Fe-Mn family superoxide dismutase